MAFQPDGIAVSPFDTPVTGAQFDLCFSFLDREEELDLTLVYRSDLYRPETAARLAVAFERLVRGVTPPPPTLERLRLLWQDVLGRADISDTEHFVEAGGHSLKAARLVARIHAEFGCGLRLREVFANPTLRAQAMLIDRATAAPAAEPAPLAPAAEATTELLVPASAGQRRLWVLAQLAGDPAVYAINATLDLEGPLDVAALTRAIDQLVVRHEVLRTRLITDPTMAVRQRILPAEASGIMLEIAVADAAPLAFDGGPLFRTRLAWIGPDHHRLDIGLHHAIGDGLSIGVLSRDLGTLYSAFRQGKPPSLPPLSEQYRHLAARQEAWLASADGDAARAYWLDVLAGDLPVLDLPAHAPRPAVQTFRGALHHFTLDPTCVEAVRALAVRHDATLFSVLLAGVNALLHRYTDASDVIVGMPVAGRDTADLENQVGLYVNTVPLRVRFDPAAGFAALVAQTGEAVTGALEHQSYPFDRLVEDLALPRDPSRSPLFDILVVMQDEAAIPPSLDGLTVREVDPPSGIAKFDLSVHFRVTAEGIDVWLEYNSDLFAADRMHRLGGHFITLFRSALQQSARPLGLLDLATQAEAEALLGWTMPAVPPYAAPTLLAAFAKHVAMTPSRPAVSCNERRLTYRELDAWANGIAARLSTLGLQAGERVAVALPRSAALPAAILGIWKAGLVYVPV
ncbi:MAG TPA: condensation domain-containing protein, partial [Rhodopila sp.]